MAAVAAKITASSRDASSQLDAVTGPVADEASGGSVTAANTLPAPHDGVTRSSGNGPGRSPSGPRANAVVDDTRNAVRGSSQRVPGADATAGFALTVAIRDLRRLLTRGLQDETAIAAARTLRHAAVRAQNRLPRHAAMALILSDALAFTEMEDLREFQNPLAGIAEGFDALLEPFIPVVTERRVLARLLEDGWELTPPFDITQFAALDPELATE